jgi:hypothetical protein
LLAELLREFLSFRMIPILPQASVLQKNLADSNYLLISKTLGSDDRVLHYISASKLV